MDVWDVVKELKLRNIHVSLSLSLYFFTFFYWIGLIAPFHYHSQSDKYSSMSKYKRMLIKNSNREKSKYLKNLYNNNYSAININ